MQKNQNSSLDIKSKIRSVNLKLRKSLSINNYYKSFSIMKNIVKNIKFNDESAVGLYWPINGEIDTRPLISLLIRKKIPVALPFIVKKQMSFKLWDYQDSLYYSKYKFYSPSENSETVIPKIIITPALAVDQLGYRIGYGKGFYDKYYSANKSSIYIGYIYSEQIFKALPFNKHDLKLNAIVTDVFYKYFK